MAFPEALLGAVTGSRLRPAPLTPLPIEAHSLTRTFGEVSVLDDVSLSVAAGEIRALLGPNGAGKTTLLRVLSGIVEPSSGTVRILGRSSSERGGHRARGRFGFIPSGDRTVYMRLTARENLIFFARLHGLSLTEARGRAEELLERVDLAHAADRRAGEYSHGMVKRLAVARALLMDPAVLFVDEATHDLDPDGSRRVRVLVEEAAARGAGVLWATQRLDEIRGFCDSVSVLASGRVRFDGTVPDLLARASAKRFLLRFDSDPRLVAEEAPFGRLQPLDGSKDHLLQLSPDATLDDALRFVMERGARVISCREEGSGMEDAFFRVTEGVAV